MEKLIIPGNQTVKGKIKVSGAKNAAVAVLPATIIAGAKVHVENIPEIDDVSTLLQILESMGLFIRRRGRNALEIDSSRMWADATPPYDLVKKLRASSYFMGSLLARFKRADVPAPGGCELGPRPIDQHLKGFAALGADVSVEHGIVKLRADKLRGAKIYLDVVSVGATINIMLAAVGAEGRTVIENVAKEPEIVDLANFLNAIGASVRGAGTDIIRIDGVKDFYSASHNIIPDRIEAGTLLMAAAATGGDLLLQDVIPTHLEAPIAKLKEMGYRVITTLDTVEIKGSNALTPVDIKTFPYPGFPTDLQPLGMVVLTRVPGTSIITENVFENRFRHVDELKRMGARIKLEGRTAVVEGGGRLTGAPIKATDLRAGAALIVAGLIAKGETILSGVEHIYRGYEDIEEKYAGIGIEIYRRHGNNRNKQAKKI
ncbi:MAG: UDP-N-acetylglucosamine 1-carboxyvinyltransferase [Firmicutes bacterium]|jgi:UDP-N-acetylglucosamine 1-carboxyvinyltransferase|nr:UDP-N-acetylglucosamine 1-carboxyvinyltransferase [Bacillota bacterium]